MSEDLKPSGSAGHVLGILVFLTGIILIGVTFKLALDMFSIDPAKAFDLGPSKALDIAKVVPTLLGIVVKVLVLCVMAMIGGMIAKRGIQLYVGSRSKSLEVE
ncbi:MAG: hypothetical protein ABL962_13935 [Fimbriimonadaceae bacterium]